MLKANDIQCRAQPVCLCERLCRSLFCQNQERDLNTDLTSRIRVVHGKVLNFYVVIGIRPSLEWKIILLIC